MKKMVLLNETTHPILLRLVELVRREPLEDRQKMLELLDRISEGVDTTLTDKEEQLLDKARTYVNLFNAFVGTSCNLMFEVRGRSRFLTEDEVDMVASAWIQHALVPRAETADMEQFLNLDLLDPTSEASKAEPRTVTVSNHMPETKPIAAGNRLLN